MLQEAASLQRLREGEDQIVIDHDVFAKAHRSIAANAAAMTVASLVWRGRMPMDAATMVARCILQRDACRIDGFRWPRELGRGETDEVLHQLKDCLS